MGIAPEQLHTLRPGMAGRLLDFPFLFYYCPCGQAQGQVQVQREVVMGWEDVEQETDNGSREVNSEFDSRLAGPL